MILGSVKLEKCLQNRLKKLRNDNDLLWGVQNSMIEIVGLTFFKVYLLG